MDLSPSTKFMDVNLKINHIYCHLKEVLVKFQGSYNKDCEFDYHILQKEIQQVSKVKDCIGIGEYCLVEDPNCGEWYRGRVIQKKDQIYEVFLIDNGEKLTVHNVCITSAMDELFQLPPKVVCGIFANIIPVEEKWSSKALYYFSSLTGLQIKGHVQAIMPHQAFLLDVPKVSGDVLELKLGKLVDRDSFHLIVEMLAESPEDFLYKQMPDLIQKKYTNSDSVFSDSRIQSDFQPVFSRFQQLLTVGEVEQVKISVAVSLSKFYCQPLQRLTELRELTGNMTSYYETINRENIPSCDSLGILCAARRKDGHWYRGVIQQLLSDNNVKVWFVDFGNCEAVPSSCVLKLHSKFVSVPRFSFPCALSCLNDQNESVRNSQLKEFKKALIRQSVIYVHIDLFSANEHLYYVTLQKYDSAMNGDFRLQQNEAVPKYCPSSKIEIANTIGNMRIPDASPVFAAPVCRNVSQSGICSNEDSSLCAAVAIPYKTAGLKLNSFCVAFVEYVLNPSNFWVQTNDNLDEFEALMSKISEVYDIGETRDKILENPEPGMLCCARYNKDMHFYRAVIEEVVDSSSIVYFLDYGNTEKVPLFDVRILLPEFQKLPALAICCSLASAFPVEDIWIKKETDFFKKMVFGKPVTLHIVGNQNSKYSVRMQYMNGSEQTDVLVSMVQAGYAECWEVKTDPLLLSVKDSKVQGSKFESKSLRRKNLMRKNSIVVDKRVNHLPNNCLVVKTANYSPRWESILSKKYGKMSGEVNHLLLYKEYRFKPGTVLNVICCDSTSPGDFSCQLQAKLPELNNLVEQMQIHYRTQTIPYQSGQLACVVKDPEDGKWYRACVQKYVSETRIEIRLVDYGKQKIVLLEDVQAILSDFMTLECQAFRCCLNSVTQSLKFDPDNWTAEACNDFKSFISSSNGCLTCTISALVIKSPSSLYNVVDLWSPLVRAQQFLLECGHDQFCSLEYPRSLAPSFSLYSFYCSSFDMNIGNEEDVCITHIHSPKKFYCQLSRNADVIDTLFQKITEICQMASCVGQINHQRLYLAKYFEDGLFYRALAFSIRSSNYLPVYFVDFGNKQVVAKDELISIPDHALEVLFTPMQAVKCYLSDLKDTDIPLEANKWFEKNCLGKHLKAVTVAKEYDGQLGVELYDNHLQISRKIKELIFEHTENCNVDPKYLNGYVEKPLEDQNVKGTLKMTAVTANIKKETENTTKSCPYDGIHGKEAMVDLQKEYSWSVQVPVASENTKLVLQNILGEKDECTRGELSNDLTSAFNEMPEKNMTESHIQQLSPSGQEMGTSNPKYRDFVQCNGIHGKETVVDLQKENSWSVQVPITSENAELVLQNILGENDECTGGELSNDLTSAFKEMPANNMTESHTKQLSPSGQEMGTSKPKYRDLVQCNIQPNSKVIAYISFITSPSSFYIHLEEDKHKILQLAKELNRCTPVLKSQMDIEEEDLVLVAYKDGCIYRGVIRTVKSETFCEVEFIDYGNSSIINVSKIYKIAKTFLNLPRFSIHCFISQATGKNWTGDDTTYFDNNVHKQQVICRFLQQHGDQWEVDLFSHERFVNKDLMQMEISLGLQTMPLLNSQVTKLHWVTNVDAESNDQSHQISHKEYGSGPTWEMTPKIVYQKIKPGQIEIAKIGHIFGNGNFYVTLTKNVQALFNINTMAAQGAKYGAMQSIPRKALLCKWVWSGKKDGHTFERVLKMLQGREIKILFVRYLEPDLTWQVDILVNGILLLECWPQITNLLESLNIVNMKMPECSFQWSSISWTVFKKNRCYPGFVTSITDPSNFCIQLEDSFKTMERLFKLLSDLPENLPALPKDHVRIGASCLIKTEPNGKWNRVEVSEISDQLMLTFVDDGISAPIPILDFHRLKVIPEKLVNLPRLTYPCSLFGVSPILGEQWNDKAKSKIQQFLHRQDLLFQFRHYYGSKMKVDVLCEGNSAADELVASGCAMYSKSINWVEFNVLNSQLVRNPLQMGSQKSFNTKIMLQPEKDLPKSDLLYTCCKCLSGHSFKKLCCRKTQCKKIALHRKRRRNEYLLKYYKSFIGHYHKVRLQKTYPTDILQQTEQKMPDPSGLSTILDVMKIDEGKPSNKGCARKVKVD